MSHLSRLERAVVGGTGSVVPADAGGAAGASGSDGDDAADGVGDVAGAPGSDGDDAGEVVAEAAGLDRFFVFAVPQLSRLERATVGETLLVLAGDGCGVAGESG